MKTNTILMTALLFGAACSNNNENKAKNAKQSIPSTPAVTLLAPLCTEQLDVNSETEARLAQLTQYKTAGDTYYTITSTENNRPIILFQNNAMETGFFHQVETEEGFFAGKTESNVQPYLLEYHLENKKLEIYPLVNGQEDLDSGTFFNCMTAEDLAEEMGPDLDE